MFIKLCLILFSCLVGEGVFQETLRYSEEHPFPQLEIVSVEGAMNVTSSGPSFSPSVLIWKKSSFKAAQETVQAGYRPLILDMANKSSPGGSVWEGAKTQEETLCRQSNLYLGLIRADYPLFEQGGVLVKNVTFFRDDAYQFLEKEFQADVFASAAYDCNESHHPNQKLHLLGYDKPEQFADYENGTKAKMRAFFRAAKENGNDALILGAFGCGAFKNDPELIARWYSQVLSESEFQNAFPLIIFAIPTEDNFNAFQNVFSVASDQHILGRTNLYYHSRQSYPSIQISEDDLERGFHYTQEIAQRFLTGAQLEEFGARFKQDLPNGCCFGISSFLAIKDPLSQDQKIMVVYFQSRVTALEILKEKVKNQSEDVEPFYLLFMQITKDIQTHFSANGKKLSLITEKVIRNGRSDQEFREEVTDAIVHLFGDKGVTSILFNVGHKIGTGHTILVHLRQPEIYDPMFGGYLYKSNVDLVMDLLKHTSSLLNVEIVWIDVIESDLNSM